MSHEGTQRVCESCGKDYIYSGVGRVSLALCQACYTSSFRAKRKQKLIDLLGGKCAVCGYDRCKQALDFHHTGDKEFNISADLHLSWDKLVKEVEKCVLLCANCHRELHAGFINLQDYPIGLRGISDKDV